MARTLTLLALLLALSGCGFATTGPGLFAASIATLVNTKKTPTDHAVSWVTGEDCSPVAMSQGKDYCKVRGNPEQLDGEAPLDGGQLAGRGPYCYRTIGRVTCYNGPDPLASEYARLD